MINKIISGFIVIMVGVSLIPEINKGINLIGWTENKKPEKPHRQTYEEYVKERLAVERMFRRGY